MSAAILMTDNWQPTVLQLMPFTSNNAAHFSSLSPDQARAYSQTRGFPTLAVTRSRGKKNVGKPVRVSSERMPRPSPHTESIPQQRARSEYGSRGKGTMVTTEKVYSFNKSNNRIVSVTPELNDSESSDNQSTLDNSKNAKVLPKPSPCKSIDGRYFLPQNGFWRSVPMTPGEVDLQRHRGKTGKDSGQSNKSKKYKLNINQLPRSTTPITDNDPDKLNIKQVIRFLQTKEQSPQSDSPHQVKCERRVKSGYSSTAPAGVLAGELVKDERTFAGAPLLVFRRETTMGVMSTAKSHNIPVLKKRGQRQTREPEHVTKSHDTNTRSSFRNTREFRLHRFLTMAPNADDFTHCTQTYPISFTHKQLLTTEYSRDVDNDSESMRNCHSPLPPHLPSRQGERYARLHYRLPSRQTESSTRNKSTASKQPHYHSKHVDLVKEGIIRLPSMLDFNNDSDNEDIKEAGTCWAAVRTPRSSSLSDPPSLEVHERNSTPSLSDKDVFSDSESPTKPLSRKVTVSLPQEAFVDQVDPSKQSTDPIRLSLRREHLLTREKTYMSDMVKHLTDNSNQGSSTKLPLVVAKSDSKTDDDSNSRKS